MQSFLVRGGPTLESEQRRRCHPEPGPQPYLAPVVGTFGESLNPSLPFALPASKDCLTVLGEPTTQRAAGFSSMFSGNCLVNVAFVWICETHPGMTSLFSVLFTVFEGV